MTKEEHIKRHKELHKYLDELIGDWISCGGMDENRFPSKSTVMELMEWSHQQTINPEKPRL